MTHTYSARSHHLPPLLLIALLAGCAGPATQLRFEQTARASGFDLPESAVFDPTSNHWFVSNIGSETGARDGDGFISRLNVDGAVVEDRWLTGFDSPAGMAIIANALYVADIDRLVVIDVERREITATYHVEGAGLLNDVAAGQDGSIYVSDTFTNVIHRLALGSAALEPFITHADFDGANGLLVVGPTLYVACTASFTDFTQEAMVFRVDIETLSVEALPAVRGKFDAVLWMYDSLVVNDFRGPVLRVGADGTPEVVVDLVAEGGLASVADMGWDAEHERLMVPDLFGNAVYLYTVGR